MKRQLTLMVLLLSINLCAITIGEIPKTVTLENDDGGLVEDGTAWSSQSIKNKVYVIFYVDPDEKDVNEEFSNALKKKEYRKMGDFGSMAIINLAATWKPNFIIEEILKNKQKEFPDTIYVKDKKSVLVNKWNLDDDASDILIFNKKGKLLFYKSGKMNQENMNQAFKLIEENL